MGERLLLRDLGYSLMLKKVQEAIERAKPIPKPTPSEPVIQTEETNERAAA